MYEAQGSIDMDRFTLILPKSAVSDELVRQLKMRRTQVKANSMNKKGNSNPDKNGPHMRGRYCRYGNVQSRKGEPRWVTVAKSHNRFHAIVAMYSRSRSLLTQLCRYVVVDAVVH